ncbi:hypothetical protein HMPREF1624_00288 [Sporothrix schenckii ATCC 58251]|uniref:Uncharacterized protein n=1 Tax=Sporothrix schenckii (strain ATCC 58251 / de Perez 2211183) TaxID=1391915 RepID=U7Q2C7_SPOS1|nr:hypothetical protein HMPREF1624_00288 [Sporothrix schenckii ATCC 58251]
MRIRHDVRVGATLHFRDDSNHTPNRKPAIIIAGIVGALVVAGFSWLLFSRWRKRRTAKYSRSGRDDNDHSEAADGPATSETTNAASATSNNASTVDRNTSVRSVMTLPPYRPKPLENESVLGREGERDGIDVVIEMPTIEDEEVLRENEMDALYQIRVARRRQIDEREARRVARREARAQNDQAALQEIREQARAASLNNTQEIENLREDHTRAKETRVRAVSSVSYADLGVARHDGTRIRANSSESERVGLLSDMASVGTTSAQSPSAAAENFPRASMHERGRSGSSLLTLVTTRSSDEQPSALHLQQTLTTGTTRSRASSTGPRDRAGSSPELIDASEAAGLADANDSGQQPTGAPPQSPPSYDEVSLNDLTPAQSRAESPYPEPPPDYPGPGPGPTEMRNRRVSAHAADLAAESSAADRGQASSTVVPSPESTARSSSHGSDDSANRRVSRNSSVLPQLPSLRLRQLPQIVIEPSSAAPQEPHP